MRLNTAKASVDPLPEHGCVLGLTAPSSGNHALLPCQNDNLCYVLLFKRSCKDKIPRVNCQNPRAPRTQMHTTPTRTQASIEHARALKHLKINVPMTHDQTSYPPPTISDSNKGSQLCGAPCGCSRTFLGPHGFPTHVGS